MKPTLILPLVLAMTGTSAFAQPAVDGRAWYVDVIKGAPQARLYFGVPEIDDVGLTLSCPPGSGQVTASFRVAKQLADRQVGGVWVDKAGIKTPWPASVKLTSGAASSTLRGKASADELDGGSFISVEIATRAPVIASFAKTGLVQATALGETISHPVATLRLVRKFLSACK